MEISLVAIGRTVNEYIKLGLEDYLKRLRRYVTYSIIYLPDLKVSKSIPIEVQKEKEGELILKEISSADFCILLDESGKEYSSKEFADLLQKTLANGRKRVLFVTGGPYGFSKSVYDRADKMVSLSRMTFTHEMARLIFTEQVYRAMTILRGEPYHHD